MIEYLKDNSDLFAITPHDMPDIDPSVTFHLLNVEAGAYTSPNVRGGNF